MSAISAIGKIADRQIKIIMPSNGLKRLTWLAGGDHFFNKMIPATRCQGTAAPVLQRYLHLVAFTT
jgi:hypothetical protein